MEQIITGPFGQGNILRSICRTVILCAARCRLQPINDMRHTLCRCFAAGMALKP